MFLERVHEIPGGRDDMESTARRLHGKSYIPLSDAEADAVWDDIESREEN